MNGFRALEKYRGIPAVYAITAQKYDGRVVLGINFNVMYFSVGITINTGMAECRCAFVGAEIVMP